MPILIKRALKVAGIMGVPLGLIALGIYSHLAFTVFLACLALVIATMATWLYLKEIGQ